MMEARATIAVIRTDADVELAASVRGTLEGIPKEQVGHEFTIEEFRCSGSQSLPDICRRARRPGLSILIEPPERSLFAQLTETEGRSTCGGSPFLLVLPQNLATDAPRLLKAGAADFVVLPFKPLDLIPRVLNLLRPHESDDELIQQLKEAAGLKQFVGQSPLLMAQLRKLPRIAAECDATVLIQGATGTGKELVSRAIHFLSKRSNKSFVPVDCGAIPDSLFESMLYGHVPGAFTDARRPAIGLVEEAQEGTILFDEVENLSQQAQVKLLRFLQEKEFRPLGSPKRIIADVRVLAATNTSLDQEVSSGRFRKDLYYRLNVLSIALPSLCDRRDDVPLLARHFIGRFAAEFQRPVHDFSEVALKKLLCYSWPGNVRELENTIERAVLACDSRRIDACDIELPVAESEIGTLSYQARKNAMVHSWEYDELRRMLAMYCGNVSALSRSERKHVTAVRALLRKHHLRGISRPPFYEART